MRKRFLLSGRRWRRTGAAASAVVALAGVIGGVTTTGTAAAVDPTPATAVVDVSVGGSRTETGSVAGLAGVVLGLVPDNGDARLSSAEFSADPTFTCTSDATGRCEFVVSGEANLNRRYWVKQVSAPSGWTVNRRLRTGPAGGGAGSTASDYAFLTPALVQGQRYQSGSNDANGFMNGAERLNGPVTDSTGTWQQSRVDPPLPTRCGLRVALVLDWSTSMAGSEAQQRSAADALVDSLSGTPSSVAVFNFSTTSPLNANVPNRPELTPVSTAGGVARVKNAYRGFNASGSTNWDQAFRQASTAEQHYDVAIMLTDGNPTSRGTAGQPQGATNRFAEMEDAIFSANQLKDLGTRIIAMGVGTGVSDQAAALNLAAISGPVAFDGTNAHTADFFQTPNFAVAANALRQLALTDCAGTLTVVKQIVLPDGTVADAVPAGPGWDITVAGTGLPGVQRTTTTDRSGAVQFDLSGATEDPLNLDVTEAQHPGYTQIPADPATGALANCVAKSVTGADVPLTVGAPPSNSDGFSVQGVPATGTTTCTLYDQAPPGTTSIVVNKVWNINGTPVPQGGQPDGLDATLGLTDPSGVPMPTTNWGQEYAEYQVGGTATISETTSIALPGCTRGQMATVTGADGVPNPLEPSHTVTLDANPDLNMFTVTNFLTCRSRLTLEKEVLGGGPATPADWTLSATPADSSSLPGFSGTTGVTSDVTANDTYVLAESGGDPRYAQADARATDEAGNPLFPGSTGSWTCVTPEGPLPYVPNFVDGIDGAVRVPFGLDVTCVASNSVATLNLAKVVVDDDGGTALPADWQLTLTPFGDAVPPGLGPVTVTGSTAGVPVLLRPGTPYSLTETGPPRYTLSFACTPDTVQTGPSGVVLGPDDAPAAGVTCTATNDDDPTTLTLRKVVDANGTGSAVGPPDFTLSAAPDGIPDQGTVSGNGDPSSAGGVNAVRVAPGSYGLGESGPPGFTAGAWACDGGEVTGTTVDVPRHAAVTCTITNTARPPHLTLVKRLDRGAPGDQPTDWTLHATGPATVEGATGSPAVTNAAVPVGAYTLSESGGPAGYTASAWQCTGGLADGAVVTVAEGSDVTCVITNSFHAAPPTTPTTPTAPAGPGAPGQPGRPGATASAPLPNTGVDAAAQAALGALLLLAGTAAVVWSNRRRQPRR